VTKRLGSTKPGYEEMKTTKPERCPNCGCKKFHKWGKYERYIIEEEGEDRICVRRIRCTKRRKTYSYLPSFCISGMSYGLDFVIKILKTLVLKMRFLYEELRRRVYEFLRRFVRSENLFMVFLRVKGVKKFPDSKRKRIEKIFIELLEFHKKGELSSDFFEETGRHFLSAK
jgi:hypothetical protein